MPTPASFPLSTKLRRHPDALWRAFDGETTVLSPSSSDMHTLNAVAARCWELSDGRSLGAMLDELEAELDVERSRLEADVRAFVAELLACGLVLVEPA